MCRVTQLESQIPARLELGVAAGPGGGAPLVTPCSAVSRSCFFPLENCSSAAGQPSVSWKGTVSQLRWWWFMFDSKSTLNFFF